MDGMITLQNGIPCMIDTLERRLGSDVAEVNELVSRIRKLVLTSLAFDWDPVRVRQPLTDLLNTLSNRTYRPIFLANVKSREMYLMGQAFASIAVKYVTFQKEAKRKATPLTFLEKLLFEGSRAAPLGKPRTFLEKVLSVYGGYGTEEQLSDEEVEEDGEISTVIVSEGEEEKEEEEEDKEEEVEEDEEDDEISTVIVSEGEEEKEEEDEEEEEDDEISTVIVSDGEEEKVEEEEEDDEISTVIVSEGEEEKEEEDKEEEVEEDEEILTNEDEKEKEEEDVEEDEISTVIVSEGEVMLTNEDKEDDEEMVVKSPVIGQKRRRSSRAIDDAAVPAKKIVRREEQLLSDEDGDREEMEVTPIGPDDVIDDDDAAVPAVAVKSPVIGQKRKSSRVIDDAAIPAKKVAVTIDNVKTEESDDPQKKKCDHCSLVIPVNSTGQWKHVWKRHKELVYKHLRPELVCTVDYCDYVGASVNSRKIHVGRTHGADLADQKTVVSEFEAAGKCPYCNADIDSVVSLKQHMCAERDERPMLGCSSCPNVSFHFIFDFTIHLKTKGGVTHGKPILKVYNA